MKKLRVSAKRATAILVKFESCITLLRMLLVCVRSYLKSFPIYTFLFFDACHPYMLYLREQAREDPLLFFEAKSCKRAKRLDHTGVDVTGRNARPLVRVFRCQTT
jgi:hypothetical protein